MKIIIVGSENIDKYSIAKKLQALDDDLTIAPVFSTDLLLDGKITDDFKYFMEAKEVEIGHKNDAFMWVRTYDDESKGVTKPDMYMSSIFVMSFSEFNNMSDPAFDEFLKDDGLVCFLDTHANTDTDKIESRFTCERLFNEEKNVPHLYFLDENINYIVDTLFKYDIGTNDERIKLLDECS